MSTKSGALKLEFIPKAMKKNRSFTIVEIMIAMSIFTLVIGGSIVLINQTLVMISLAHQRLIAYYLAQEGIELVRNIRDNNWIQQQTDASYSWSFGFPIAAFNQNYSDHSLDFEIDYDDVYNPGNSSGLSSYTGKYLSLDSNGYNYNTSGSGTATPFMRWVRIGTENESDGSTYIRIECHVKWKERGREHSIMVQDKLYDWYGVRP